MTNIHKGNIGDIPSDVMAAIEQDVERYRQVRINAARKRLTPEYLERIAKRAEHEWVRANREQIVQWFASGETIAEINRRFKFIGKNRIREEIENWLYDALNPDTNLDTFNWDRWTRPPRFSEQGWRSKVVELINP
jgi:hypothetical protein